MRKNMESKKKFKITKKHLRKAFDGSISILLCLLLTPFLTIALCLVEYSRYQQVISMADELYELTGISILSDYDTYIHNRFGLLATSQEDELDAELETYFSQNLSALGGQATAADPSIDGKTALSDLEVLRQQVVDFSEMTVTTAILAEDFNLEKLLDKLNTVQAFSDVKDTVNTMKEITDSLTTALRAFETLQAALTDLIALVDDAVTQAETLADQMATLFQKLGDEGIALPQNASLAEIEAAVTAFSESYLQDFKDLYATANSLIEDIEAIKGQLDTIQTAAEDVVEAVEAAEQLMNSAQTENSADQEGEISEAAKSALQDVLDEMLGVVDSTIKEIETTLIDTAEDTLNQIVETTLEETGLAGLTTRYSEIVNGEYFGEEMSETAKQDIIDFLKIVYEVYTDASGNADIWTAIKDFLLEKFVPNLGFDAETWSAEVGIIIDKATQALVGSIEDKVWTLLTDLVNLVRGLFNLDVYFNPELNAYVDIAGEKTSGYEDFLDAIGRLFTAIGDFETKAKGADIFGALDAMGRMFEAIYDMLGAIFSIVEEMLSSMLSLGEAAVTLDGRELYERLLISAYMTHNLPNRTSALFSEYDKGEHAVLVPLKGESLTGFAYNNIPRPALFAGQDSDLPGTSELTLFQQIGEFIGNMQQGHGEDEMFMGAELEYIRAGTNSEIVNQTVCFMDIFFLRILMNLPTIFTDLEVAELAAAATIGAWVVYILYIVIEPLIDTILLVNGGTVHLIKGNCWVTVSGMPGLIDELTNVAIKNEDFSEEVNGFLNDELDSFVSSQNLPVKGTKPSFLEMTYGSNMLLVLFIYVDPDEYQLPRLQDLIELEASVYYDSFDLDKAYTSIEISGDLTINTLIDFGLLTGDTSIIPSARLKQILGY